MNYPGDTYNFVLTLTTPTGVAPNVTSSPVITIVSLATNSSIVSSQAMTAVSGTSNQVYTYSWNTASLANGDYLALVSYAHDSITVNSQFLEKVKLGDSRVIGIVAQDSTVAKDLTVAKDSTVAHLSDLVNISPNNSTLVQSIAAKTTNLPSDPASNTNVSGVLAIVTQIVNAILGTWTINKVVSPNVLTYFNPDSSVLATYNITDSPTASQRTRTS